MALFGGLFGDDTNFGPTDPAALYGGLLSPKQNSALAYQGLLAAAGALGQAAMPSRMPIPTGAALGMAAGAMGQGQQSAAENAMKGSLLGLQGQHLNWQMGLANQLMNDPRLQAAMGGQPAGTNPGGGLESASQTSGGAKLASVPPYSPGGTGNWETQHNNFAGMRIPGVIAGPNSGGFQSFDTPEAGIQAISHQLDRYASGATTGKPLTTIKDIVSTWAPPSENDTNALINRATQIMGVGPNTALNLADPNVKAKLIEVMIRNEQGGKLPVDPATIASVVGAKGTQYAQANTGTATDATPDISPSAWGAMGGQGAPPQGPLAASNPTAPPVAMPASAMQQGGGANLGSYDPGFALKLGMLGPMAGLGEGLAQIYQNSPAAQAAITGAKSWAGIPAELYKAWNSPRDLRVNGMEITGPNGRVVARNPAVPEGYTVGQDANGNPVAEEVPGAIAGIGKVEATKKGGGYQAEYGNVPGVNFQGQPFNSGTATPAAPASKEPVATPHGTQLPPISEQFMPQSPAELEHALPAWQKKTDEWNAAIAPARQAEMRLQTIADAFKLTESGAFTTHKAELAAALKALGIDPGLATSTDPSAVQQALHDNMLTTLPILKAATPRPSQIEFMSLSENREHPNLQPSANLKMLSEDMALVRQAQQLPADWNMAQQQGWRNPQSFETAWSRLNPLEDARTQAAKDIGPLKGMNGTKPIDQATRNAAQNAIMRGADRAKVIKMMQDNGFDTTGF